MDQELFIRERARQLYWQGYQPVEIARLMGINQNTVYSWKKRHEWDDAQPIERVKQTIDAKICQLVNKSVKTGGDLKEIDLLTRQLKRLAPAGGEMPGKKRSRKLKNHFTETQTEKLRDIILSSLYDHQAQWYEQRNQRNRMILKSRQIGASWYFAREALLDALDTSKPLRVRNQIFLSASRRQAYQFRGFIQKLAQEVDVELKGGDKITLSDGAELHFLGTSAATAQSYTGNLYFDEYFWVPRFRELRKVAGGMATQTGLRRTYFSTPSSEDHEAYEFWTGQKYNASRRAGNRVDIDTTHKALMGGRLCADKVWRQIVTMEDTIDQGFDLVDLSEIIDETPPDEYRNLYACEFVRRGNTAFDYDLLLQCGVDSFDEWEDYRPFATYPLADRPVWIGYDATGSGESGDGAGLVVLAPPLVEGGKFRVVEVVQLHDKSFEEQADVIEQLTLRYNVQHISIDGTGGYGSAVHELVTAFFPAAECYQFSAGLKRALVQKTQLVMRAGRLEFDTAEKGLIAAFNTVRKVITPGGIITYESSRQRDVSHGDVAWATMLAIFNEPMNSAGGGSGGFEVTAY
jgi:uncharacterized protein YjcR